MSAVRGRPPPGPSRRSGRRAHRRRHLHRQRHPRLPRPQRRLDQEPRRREGGHPAELPGRPRGAEAGVAQPPRLARPGPPSPTPATGPSSPSSVRASCTPSSPRTSTACTRPPAATRPASSRSTAPSARWSAWTAASGRPMERALDRVRAGEDDPACRTCGGILKSATISFGQSLVADDLGSGRAGRPGVRPAARRRLDAGRLPHLRRRADRPAPGRAGRHRQRRAHPVRRPRRRRRRRLDQRGAPRDRRE